ncbi:MAG: Asp/Glu racemase [Pseudomonadota bacterium]
MHPFAFKVDPCLQKKLGLIILQSDETIENEFRKIIPHDCTFYHARIPSAPEVTPQTLAQMEYHLPATARLLPSSSPFDVIGYACTSGATIIGPNKIQSILKSVHPHALICEPISALSSALQSILAHRIGFVSPYIEQVSKKLRDHLTKQGFEINHFISFDQKDEHIVAHICEEDTLEAVKQAAKSNVDSVFISCTNLRSFNIIKKAEKIISKPVISSNSALAWDMFKKANLDLNHAKHHLGTIFDNPTLKA